MRGAQFLQHQVAACPGALGVFARIVEGRALDQADQHREFPDIEFRERLGEVILAAQPESMDGPRAILAEIHLVEVGNENLLLGEIRLQPQRHDGFGRLAAETLLVRQKVILDQLLRERAAALHHPSGPKIGPHRAHYAAHIDAVMLIEAPVFDDLDSGAQQRRHVGRRQDQAVLPMNGENAADHRRIEAKHRQVLGVGLLQARDRIRVRADHDQLRLTLLIAEAHAARVQNEGISLAPIITGARQWIAGTVVQPVQFLFQIVRRHRRTDVELQGRRIHMRRHRPVPALKLPLHHPVQMRNPQRNGHRKNEAHHNERRSPAKQSGSCLSGSSQSGG
jgi:hypothetical protein